MAGIAAVLTPLFSFYDVVFQPLLAMGPYVSLLFFSVLLAGLFSVIYWFLLDIERADEIKEKLNEYQDKMKEAREEDEEEKASEHLKKTLHLNQKFMMLNLKPMIATMVFVGLFFPWLGATYAPKVQMDQVSNNTFTGEMNYAGETQKIQVTNSSGNIEVNISGESRSLQDEVSIFDIDWRLSSFKQADAETYDAKMKVAAEFVKLPFSLPLVGGALNWLGFYIIIVMPLTYIFRKLLGVQ
jgi:uncharacterized membrane protein (DUF106 family)